MPEKKRHSNGEKEEKYKKYLLRSSIAKVGKCLVIIK